MKKNNRKGFTLAELLIVVAIIAVLVAIAIPVFTGQLDKAKLATATANVRSAYAEYVADCLSDGKEPEKDDFSYSGVELQDCTVSVGDTEITVTSPKNNINTIPVEWGSNVTGGAVGG